MNEHPKMMYKGTFSRSVGLSSLSTMVAANPTEEEAARKDGWAGPEDIESLADDKPEEPKKKGKKAATDAGTQ